MKDLLADKFRVYISNGYNFDFGVDDSIFYKGTKVGDIDEDGDVVPSRYSSKRYLTKPRDVEEWINILIDRLGGVERDKNMNNEVSIFNENTVEDEYVNYARIVYEFTEAENAILDELDTPRQKGEYIKKVLAERNTAEVEAIAKENKKQANRAFIGVLAYLIVIFPLSYLLIENVSLNILPSVGAAILAIFITAVLVVLLIIRKIVMEYHDIKSRLFIMWEKRIWGEMTIRDVVILLVLLGVFINVI